MSALALALSLRRLFPLFRNPKALAVFGGASLKLAGSGKDLALACMSGTSTDEAGKKFLSDLIDLVTSLSGNIAASELDKAITVEQREHLDHANQHFVRFTGCVIEALLRDVIADRAFNLLPTQRASVIADRESLRQQLLRALPGVPQAWSGFVQSQPVDVQPLSREDFVRELGQMQLDQLDGPAIPPDVLVTFLTGWLPTVLKEHAESAALSSDLAQSIAPRVSQAISDAIATDHPAARAALAKTLLLHQADFGEQLGEIKAALLGIGETLSAQGKKITDIHAAVVPPPVDATAAITAYAKALIKDLSPVPLTQIFDDGKSDTIGVQQVFTPLMIREVRTDDIEHLIHAKEALDYADREGDHDTPEELRRKKERIAEILSRSVARPATKVFSLRDMSHHLLLGEPGGGKTLLARHLALRWAESWPIASAFSVNRPLHIYVELRHYAEKREAHVVTSLRSYITGEHNRYGLMPASAFDEAANSQALVLILDGLDEIVSSSTKESIVKEICTFDNFHFQIIVTSRIADFQTQSWRSVHAWEFHRIDPLTPAEQQVFIEKYHRAFFPNAEDCQQRLAQLRTRLRDFHRLAELAGTPLLLTLICLVNRSGARAETRTELYEQAAELLLHRWDDFRFEDGGLLHHRNLSPLAKSEKHAILRRLAWLIMMGLPASAEEDEAIPCARQHLSANLFPQKLIEIATRQVLRETNKPDRESYVELILHVLEQRNSVLCPATPGMHSFIHRTFLEFYAAWAWKQEKIPWNDEVKWKDKRWPLKMSPAERFEHLYKPHWQDSVWRVILILHCARYDDAEDVQEIIQALVAESDKKAAEAGPAPEGRENMALQLESQEALLLAAEAFSETRERGRLSDLLGELIGRLQGLAAGDFSTENTSVRQDESNREHRRTAVRLAVQLPINAMSSEGFLRRLSENVEAPLASQAAALLELSGLWGAGEVLRAYLHALLLRKATSDSLRNVALRQIDERWRQEGLDLAFSQLASARHFIRLDLSGCTGLTSLPRLGALKQLKKLDLQNCIGLHGPQVLEELGGLEALRVLHLSGCTGLTRLSGLGALKHLEAIELRFCSRLQGPEVLEELGGLRALRRLDLSGCTGLTLLSGLGALKQLGWLNLRNCTGLQGVEELGGLEALQRLYLDGCTGLTRLSGLGALKQLGWLNLRDCTGLQGLEELRGLEALQELHLDGCTGLTRLSGLGALKRLRTLSLRNCTGLQGPEVLEELSGLNALEWLFLPKLPWGTDECVQAFKESVMARRKGKGAEIFVPVA